MANEHLKFEDDVPQFSGKINERFVEWVTDVRLWEAEHKDETKPRLEPRLFKRRLLGQPKQITKTLLSQGDPSEIHCGQHHGDAQKNGLLDNYFDMRMSHVCGEQGMFFSALCFVVRHQECQRMWFQSNSKLIKWSQTQSVTSNTRGSRHSLEQAKQRMRGWKIKARSHAVRLRVRSEPRSLQCEMNFSERIVQGQRVEKQTKVKFQEKYVDTSAHQQPNRLCHAAPAQKNI